MFSSGYIRVIFFLLAFHLLPEPASSQRLNLFGTKKTARHINPVTGFSDNVYDRFGKKYHYTKIAAKKQNNISDKSFKAGWFNVFFAKGSGMDEDSNSLHIKRRKILFEVLTNVSGMINVPEAGRFTGVNLLVDKLSSHVPDDRAEVPGVGSSFYTFPHLPSNPDPGIVDGLIYNTLCTGNDAWPGDTGTILHGFIALNFGFKWNLDTGKDCAAYEYDLYTVCLRELMHSLGFASLIGANGSSVFGKENNYYSRYDMFLTRYDMLPLISCSATSYPFYDLKFNVPASILHPNDITSAKNGICFYDSVYKIPICLSCPLEHGNLLSYFCESKENDHAVMSCLNIRGYIARVLNPLEKQVLCDLKYPLSASFTGTVAHRYSAVSVQVWACNDGIVEKEFIYKSEGEQIIIPKWGVNGILSNDSKTVIDASFIRNTYVESGYVANNPREIIFTPAPDFSGETILEYIPVDGKGNYGNITYVYVSVSKNKHKKRNDGKK